MGSVSRGWGALQTPHVPHCCNECVPVSASLQCPGLCIAQGHVKSAHPHLPLMLQIIQQFPADFFCFE